jgi:hypothetical protein
LLLADSAFRDRPSTAIRARSRGEARHRARGRATVLPVAAASPPASKPRGAKAAWVAERIAKLTPEERLRYERSAFFRDFVELALAEEWDRGAPMPSEGSPADWAADFLTRFPSVFSDEERAQAAKLREETYGSDVERERADIEARRHPFQRKLAELQSAILKG